MAERDGGISLNGKTIPVYLGMLALASALYTGVSTINAYGFQVDKVQAEQVVLGNIASELKHTVQGLNDSITNLTIVMNRVEDRYNQIEDRLDKVEQRVNSRNK